MIREKRNAYPKAREVTAEDMSAKGPALAKLSVFHARKWTNPANTEQAPTALAISANIKRKLVDIFPPKSV